MIKATHLAEQLEDFSYLFQRRQNHAIVFHLFNKLRDPVRLLYIPVLRKPGITHLSAVCTDLLHHINMLHLKVFLKTLPN